MSECIGKHELEAKTIIKYFVDEFRGNESVCLPLRTCYETNTDIFKSINELFPCDNLKIAEECENKRVVDYLHRIKQENLVKNELGFSPNLFKKLIAVPLVYTDKDLVRLIVYILAFDSIHSSLDRLQVFSL